MLKKADDSEQIQRINTTVIKNAVCHKTLTLTKCSKNACYYV